MPQDEKGPFAQVGRQNSVIRSPALLRKPLAETWIAVHDQYAVVHDRAHSSLLHVGASPALAGEVHLESLDVLTLADLINGARLSLWVRQSSGEIATIILWFGSIYTTTPQSNLTREETSLACQVGHAARAPGAGAIWQKP
jgi:hypothetical protein